MGTPETSREPCPDRILDDLGGAFGMGAVGGSVFHFIKGVYSSPKGERLLGGTQAVGMNAPRIGGSFAVWGGLFSVFDCTAVYLRQKEDPWNSIFAGAATGGFLQMRQGSRAAARSAVFGGVLLALIEGAGIMLNRVLSQQQQQMPPIYMDPSGNTPFPAHQGLNPNPNGGMAFPQQGVNPNPMGVPGHVETEESSSSSSWFDWFKKKEDREPSKAKSSELLFEGEVPVPNFELK
eukprot:TRINITY_DN4569_c0_g1_i1.p1 TRINITY_DN4569_c0_g1~~TRINITY_DN4569_c0_g1_i1.p1  ORF type:complete len:235 (-),score=19.67 TRINITY_DN4569_c0_g1_i1:93-797(-)